MGWKTLNSELEAYLGSVETQRRYVCEMGGKEERKEPSLRKPGVVDAAGQNILRILSLYDHLTALQLWYEMGEDHVVKGSISEEMTGKRLEPLVTRGLVEEVRKAGVHNYCTLAFSRVKRHRQAACG